MVSQKSKARARHTVARYMSDFVHKGPRSGNFTLLKRFTAVQDNDELTAIYHDTPLTHSSSVKLCL